MKKYRIVTNGENFRVQHRVKLGPLDFWRTDHYYEVKESYPKVIKRPVEFRAFDEAEDYVETQLAQIEPKRPKEKRWQTVRKYSDKLSPTGA